MKQQIVEMLHFLKYLVIINKYDISSDRCGQWFDNNDNFSCIDIKEIFLDKDNCKFFLHGEKSHLFFLAITW